MLPLLSKSLANRKPHVECFIVRFTQLKVLETGKSKFKARSYT